MKELFYKLLNQTNVSVKVAFLLDYIVEAYQFSNDISLKL